MFRRYIVYYQNEAMDCGAVCLMMIAKYYGKKYDLQSIKIKIRLSENGVSLLGVSDAAESLGFSAKGVWLSWEQLRDGVHSPCIVYWNQCHFVVLYDIYKRANGYQILVADPAQGLIKYNEKEFLEGWIGSNERQCGVALLLEPTRKFYFNNENTSRRLGLGFIVGYVRPYRRLIVQILLAMLVASLISLMLPFITQAIVDKGIRTGNLHFVIALLFAQLFLSLGGMANGLVRGWLMLHMTSRVSISLISDYLNKLMKLPIIFFSRRTVGEIIMRINDYSRIQNFLTGTLLSIVIALVSLIVYSIIMAGFNGEILLIFFIGTIMYLVWVLILLKKRRKLDYLSFRQTSANQNIMVQLVEGIQDIKLNGCEKQKRWAWEGVQAKKLFKIYSWILLYISWQKASRTIASAVSE